MLFVLTQLATCSATPVICLIYYDHYSLPNSLFTNEKALFFPIRVTTPEPYIALTK